MILKISNRELQTLVAGEPEVFPKYTTQILNLANQNAGGTRPRVGGQMSDLIGQFPGDSFEDWTQFYLELYPHSMETATEKIEAMVENLKLAIEQIDRPMPNYRALGQRSGLGPNFCGPEIPSRYFGLKKVAAQTGEPFRSATTGEEAQGIDGFIGGRPVSIKPDSYRSMQSLPENIGVEIIFYSQTKDGLRLEIPEL